MVSRPNSLRGNLRAAVFLGVILLVALLALLSVLQMRYETGESYPVYSSLRADPMGTRALYEALSTLPGTTTSRNFESFKKLKSGRHNALILCGLNTKRFNQQGSLDGRALARFATDGGRLIIALDPAASETSRVTRSINTAEEELDREEEKKEKELVARKKKNGPKEADPEEEKAPAPRSDKGKPFSDAQRELAALNETLKVSAIAKGHYYNEKGGTAVEFTEAARWQGGEVRWYSNVFWDDNQGQNWQEDWRKPIKKERAEKKKNGAEDLPEGVVENDGIEVESVKPSPWKVLATIGKRPVILERKLGSGSVVVCTDRYFLSNEALWREPNARFLSWLLGDVTNIVFEETHLGFSIGDVEGIMTLARRYRMHGLFLGGILLFALTIWRYSLSLVPPNTDDDLGLWRNGAVAGQSTASGLEGLLRRGINQSHLLARCLEVWGNRKAVADTSAAFVTKQAQAQETLKRLSSPKQAPQAYREIRDILHPKR